MTKKTEITAARSKKETIARISSWLNDLTPVQLKKHIRTLLKTSPECYSYFASIVTTIDNNPELLLNELDKKISKLIISEKRYHHNHSVQPPDYSHMIDFAESILNKGVDMELMEILAEFSETLGEQITLFDQDDEWHQAGLEVYEWIDDILNKTNLPEEYKLVWRAQRLLNDDNYAAKEQFEGYIHENLSQNMLNLICDAYLQKVHILLRINSSYMPSPKQIVKVLKMANRTKDIPSELKKFI